MQVNLIICRSSIKWSGVSKKCHVNKIVFWSDGRNCVQLQTFFQTASINALETIWPAWCSLSIVFLLWKLHLIANPRCYILGFILPISIPPFSVLSCVQFASFICWIVTTNLSSPRRLYIQCSQFIWPMPAAHTSDFLRSYVHSFSFYVCRKIFQNASQVRRWLVNPLAINGH